MTDIEVYLEKLAGFSDLLRADGLSVGLQETADAARTLIQVGLTDRELVKAALMTVYAKSRDEQKTFSRAFDSFFVPEEVMRRQAMDQIRQQDEYQKARARAEEELRQGGPQDLTEDQISTYAMMPDEARKRLKEIIQAYKPRTDHESKLYTGFIHSVFAKAILEQQMKMEDVGLGADEADPEAGLQFRDITLFKDSEIPRATALIKNISARINGELSAKKKRAGHSGTLDFRRTIRKGLETGGSFHRLAYKRPHSRKKHLVLLCDVSGSMVQFSEFALRFIQEMTQVSESS
ncbi:MAG: VWA domain-containing protein, partial [Lachnospiraceae bacterium]|nr:VWA domain-containing protein [Lachnospiraceae bacterium]